jgi:hypothetical protein
MRLLALILLCSCGPVLHQVERGIAYEVRDCEYGRQRANPFWYSRCAEDGERACVVAGLGATCWRDYDLEVELPGMDTHWIGGR